MTLPGLPHPVQRAARGAATDLSRSEPPVGRFRLIAGSATFAALVFAALGGVLDRVLPLDFSWTPPLLAIGFLIGATARWLHLGHPPDEDGP